MYEIFNASEREQFLNETETVICMRGQTCTMGKTINYFDMVVKDKVDKTNEFPTFSGSYTINTQQLVITNLKIIGDELVNEAPGIQKLVAEATLKRFRRLAKVNLCTELVVYTGDIIFVEEMFKQKFRMVKLICANYEVRAEIDI